MPERTVLQQAANVARLLGDTDNAEWFELADRDHTHGNCPAESKPCRPEKKAGEYLDKHTDGDDIVAYIGFDLPTFAELAERRSRRAQSTYSKVAEAYRQLWDQVQRATIAQLTDENRRLRADLDGRVRALATALGTKPDNTPTGGLYGMCQDVADMRSERNLLLWLHAEAVWQRDQARVEQALTRTTDEAQAELRAYRDLLGCIELYVNWRYVTKQLTTEQKELWAYAVEQWQPPDGSNDPAPPRTIDRWWRDSEQIAGVHGRG